MSPKPALFSLYLQDGQRRQQEEGWESKRVVKKCNTGTLLETLAGENLKNTDIITEMNERKECFSFELIQTC